MSSSDDDEVFAKYREKRRQEMIQAYFFFAFIIHQFSFFSRYLYLFEVNVHNK